jgi:hypothetical protein
VGLYTGTHPCLYYVYANYVVIAVWLVDVVEIQLFFGASVTSPREMYVLHMPPFRGSVNGETIEINEKQHRECLRRTIRSFIHYWGEVCTESMYNHRQGQYGFEISVLIICISIL